jgi:hypothetical protein
VSVVVERGPSAWQCGVQCPTSSAAAQPPAFVLVVARSPASAQAFARSLRFPALFMAELDLGIPPTASALASALAQLSAKRPELDAADARIAAAERALAESVRDARRAIGARKGSSVDANHHVHALLHRSNARRALSGTVRTIHTLALVVSNHDVVTG